MSRLSIAIPSKGRLKDNAEKWLGDCGFRLSQKGGERGYRAEISGLDADVMLLSAREIAEGLIAGSIHIGITGQDLLHDLSSDVDADVSLIKRLGFGGADVIVAVPQCWLDVETMADLEGAAAQFRQVHGRRIRVATKYLRLTREFFASRSIGDYRLVESAGATEAAPSSGTADVIVDITTTGATLKANALKIVSDGVILKSEAVLAGSLKANWSEETKARIKDLLIATEARELAETHSILIASQEISDGLIETLGLQRLQPTQVLSKRRDARDSARKLMESGRGPITIKRPDFVFRDDNAVIRNFLKKV